MFLGNNNNSEQWANEYVIGHCEIPEDGTETERETHTYRHKLKALIKRALESSTKLHLYWCRVSYIIARVR